MQCRGRDRGSGGDRDARSDGFEESVLNISRVCKVVKGGRHVAFRADVVVGNQRGLVRPPAPHAPCLDSCIPPRIISLHQAACLLSIATWALLCALISWLIARDKCAWYVSDVFQGLLQQPGDQ